MNFSEPYERGEFIDFMRDFVPDFSPNSRHKDLNYQSGENDYINKVVSLGSIEGSVGRDSHDKFAVLEVTHESEHDPRVSLTREAFRLFRNRGINLGILAFVSEESPNWRFSLITSEVVMEDGNIENKFSDPRRFSFYLGPDAKTKTPQMYLDKKGEVINFEDLKKRFDIRVLTKEFYEELSNWYFWAVRNVEFPDDAEEQEGGRNIAVIRLITRLIFIWFMKEKGDEKSLVPEDLFSEEEIKEILGEFKENGSSYYRAILQNLFFATLNTPIEDRKFGEEARGHKGYNEDFMNHNVFRYQEYFEEPDEMKGIFEDIPFLNGGLFECLDRRIEENGETEDVRIDGFTRIKKHQPGVPNYLFFTEGPKEIDLNEEYDTQGKEYEVRGLVNILNDYNFTIDENTPIDQEMSLDPELLGRIFENLLASYNPETATTARKATGSYYTPRLIVDYMVNESLKEYFLSYLEDSEDSNDSVKEKLDELLSFEKESHDFNEHEVDLLIEAINELKIIDPAVGSGAFPMGVLQKLVLALEKLDPDNKKWKERQIEAVKENVTDVTIRKKLIEKIEDDFQKNRLNYGRKLYLIRDAIYGVDIQPIAVQICKLRFFISLLVDEDLDRDEENFGIEALPNLETKFISANSLVTLNENEQHNLTSPRVEKLENELEQVREDYFMASLPEEKEKVRAKDAEIREKLKSELEKSGFPKDSAHMLAEWDPYDINSTAEFFDPEWMFGVKEGFDVVIANPPYIKEYVDKSAFDGLRDSPYYMGKMDLWHFFGCRSIDLLRPNGVMCFIAENTWVSNYGAKLFRKKIIDDAEIKSFVDFGDYMVFEESDTQTMVLVLQKNDEKEKFTLQYKKLLENEIEREQLNKFLNSNKSQDYTKSFSSEFNRETFRGKYFKFHPEEISSIIGKLSSKGDTDLKKQEVRTGIDVHQDFVIKKHLSDLDSEANIGDGIFVISGEEKENMKLTAKDEKLLRPYYTSEELTRHYGNRENNYWVIYTESDIDEYIDDYPGIKAHLDKYSEVITSDNAPYGLHRARVEKIFKGEQIISKRKCKRPTFTYTDFDCYVAQTFMVINTERFDLKFLTGLLNSSVVRFWLRHMGKMQGDNFQVDKKPLLNIPLLKPKTEGEKEIRNKIIKKVDLIRDERKENPEATLEELEMEVDRLVYQLYDLSDDEIQIVEQSVENL